MSNAMLSLSGSALRALNTPEAQAEIARRAAKREESGTWTVAAAKSQGRDDIVAAKLAAKPAPAPKGDAAADKALRKGKGVMGAMLAGLKADPAYLGTPAFTRTTPALPEAVKAPRLTLKVMDARVAGIEGAVLALAANQASMKDVLDLIAKRLIAA